MKTQELIELLAQDACVQPSPSVTQRFAFRLLPGWALVVALVAFLWGLNPALHEVLDSGAGWLKLIWLALLGLATWSWLQRLARPAGKTTAAAASCALVIASMPLLGALQWLGADDAGRGLLWRGTSWTNCTLSIVVLALPLLGLLFWVMRDLAPTQPRLAGGAAGLTAGAWAALAYALHCPEVAFTFLALWYGASLLAMSALGAWLGGRWLRW